MRLLFFTPIFPAHEQDSTSVPPLQHLVRELGRKGADVQVITLEFPFFKRPYRWHNATVWPCNGRNSRWKKPLTVWRALNHAHNLCKEEKFDSFHSFWLGMTSDLADNLAEKENTPHFTTLMGQDATVGNQSYLKNLTEKDAPQLVALSKFHNAVFEENTGFPCGNVIPWGLAEDDVAALPLPADRPIDVLGVGHLTEGKNWSRWLQIVSQLVEQKPDLQAVLIGVGELERQLEAEILQLNLTENVHLAGAFPRPQVLAQMREAKVLLHTSEFESFGMVLAEALASGCRVVSTPVGIAPELPETFVADDDHALAQAVLEKLGEPFLEKPVVPYTLRDCGWAYWDLYHRS